MGELARIKRLFTLVRLKPVDVSNEEGRALERGRRATLTSVAAGMAKIIFAVTMLLSMALTFRYLGPERFGLWMVLTSIVTVLGLADFGVGNGLLNAISDAYGKNDRELAREYVTSALFLMIRIALGFALLGLVAYPFLPWQKLLNVTSSTAAAEGSRAFLVLYAWFVINIPLGLVIRIQSGIQKGYWSHVVNACGNLLSLLGVMAVVWIHGSLVWLVLASTSGALAATIVNGRLLFGEFPWLFPRRQAYHPDSARKILNLGLMFFILQCAVCIGFTSDNIVITQILGAAAVGMYAVPQKMYSFVGVMVSTGIGPLWPAFGEAIARGDIAWIRRVFWMSLRLSLVISASACSILLLAGPWLLRVAIGRQLIAPMSLLVVLALWSVVISASAPPAVLLNGAGILKAQAGLAVVSSSANLILSVFLTRRYGVIGVCLGSLVSQVFIVLPVYGILIHNFFRRLALGTHESVF